MVLDTSVITMLLSDNIARLVFEEIHKNRSTLFKEILNSLGKNEKNPDELSREEVESAISRLKDAHLVKERKAEIEDFNSYYITSDGLTAERRLRNIENNPSLA